MEVTLDIAVETFTFSDLPPRGADIPTGFNEEDIDFNWNDFAFNEVDS